MENKTLNLPKEELPKERLIRHGVASLSNQDLFSVLLGEKENNIKSTSILKAFEGIKLLREATTEELTAISGIGESKAAVILASIELGKRVNQYQPMEDYIVRSPEDGADYLMEDMRSLQQEHFVTLFLDTKNKITHKKTIFIGSLNASVVHPREIFKEAVKRSASSIIISHNHPSGNPTPSQEDIHVTRRVVEVGKMMGIECLDHLIIGNKKFTSLKEKGYM